MENLNAEQVKRGLECLNNKVDRDCNTCPIFWEARKSPITQNCRHIILDAALALINSQEQRIKELTEENERLKAEVSVKKKLLDKCVDIEDEVKADTVRKMHSMLCEDRVSNDPVVIAVNVVAKEMLEDNNND